MKELDLVDLLRRGPPEPTNTYKPRIGRRGAAVVETTAVIENGPVRGEVAEYEIVAKYGATFNIAPGNDWRERLSIAHRSAVRAICRGLFGSLWAELGEIERLAHAHVTDYEALEEIRNRINGIFEATGGRL